MLLTKRMLRYMAVSVTRLDARTANHSWYYHKMFDGIFALRNFQALRTCPVPFPLWAYKLKHKDHDKTSLAFLLENGLFGMQEVR